MPNGIDGIAGVMAIETSCAGEMQRPVDPVTEPEAAKIATVPVATLLASPAVESAATVLSDELQSTVEVRSCVLPSLKIPVATSCWVVPRAMVVFAGVMAMDCSTAGSTVSDAELETIDPNEAVMFVGPVLRVPAKPVAFTVATE